MSFLDVPEINIDTTNPACMTQLHNISRTQLGLGEYKLETTSTSTVKNDLGFFKWGWVASIAVVAAPRPAAPTIAPGAFRRLPGRVVDREAIVRHEHERADRLAVQEAAG